MADLFDQEELGADLATNGNMEIDLFWSDYGTPAINERSSEQAHGGTYSRKFVADSPADGISGLPFTTTIGAVYKMSAWVHTSQASVRLIVNDGVTNIVLSDVSVIPSVWTKTSAYFIAKRDGSVGYIAVSGLDIGTYYIDDVSAEEVTAPGKGLLSWPALAGDEAITAQNDRDFSSGNVGNWVVEGDGAGTCTYSNADLDGADDKQGLLTSSGDSFLLAVLPTTEMSLTANTLFKVSVRVYVPVGNTLKAAQLAWRSITGEIPTSISLSLGDDAYETLSGYFYLAADIIGDFMVGFFGNPTDADLMYIDDISIRPVLFSWTPYGTNLMKLDETEGAFHVTYVDDSRGAKLNLSNSNDLTDDLTVGARYFVTFEAKVGLGDVIQCRIFDGVGFVADTGNIEESFTIYQLVFTAMHATSSLINFNSMGAGEEVWIRNVTIQPIGAGGGMGLGLDLTLR